MGKSIGDKVVVGNVGGGEGLTFRELVLLANIASGSDPEAALLLTGQLIARLDGNATCPIRKIHGGRVDAQKDR